MASFRKGGLESRGFVGKVASLLAGEADTASCILCRFYDGDGGESEQGGMLLQGGM